MRCEHCAGGISDGCCINCGSDAGGPPARDLTEEPPPLASPDEIEWAIESLVRSMGGTLFPGAPAHFCAMIASLCDGYTRHREPLKGSMQSVEVSREVVEQVRPVCRRCVTPWEGVLTIYTSADSGQPMVAADRLRELAEHLGARFQTPDTLVDDAIGALADAGVVVCGAAVVVGRPCAGCRIEEGSLVRAIRGAERNVDDHEDQEHPLFHHNGLPIELGARPRGMA